MTGNRLLKSQNAVRAMRGLFLAMGLMVGLATAATAEESNMTEIRPELRYTLTVHGENMQARIYVNGAPLLLHADTAPLLITVPITETLTTGTNFVIIDYEPLNVEQRSYTPHDGVKLQVSLDRRSNPLDDTSQFVTETVQLFSGRYDVETRQMKAEAESVFGQGPVKSVDGGLAAGPVQISPVEMQFNNRVSEGHAERISMRFQVDDTPMPTPPWIDSPELADTGDLRSALSARYQELHDIIARGSEAEFRNEMRYVYQHGALALGYTDAAALADDVRSKTPLGPEPGTRLAPLPSDLSQSRIEFGSDNRLVRFMPSPLRFETPDGSSAGAYRLFFCRIGEKLEICFMQSIPS